MRARLEILILVLALAAAGAFIVSFALGWHPRAQTPAIASDSAATSPAVIAAPGANAARVEVLNASGRAGLAHDATDRLRASGFDVVYFGNAQDSARATSVVIDRIGRLDAAHAIAAALAITQVRSEPDSTRLVDASVLLGADWPPRRVAPAQKTWRQNLRELWPGTRSDSSSVPRRKQ
jgi:hypothetical protein